MKTTTDFLASLSAYPAAYEINDASNEAQNKCVEYVQSIDDSAIVTIEDGEVYITSSILDDEQKQNAQVMFDEEFSDQIIKLGYSM